MPHSSSTGILATLTLMMALSVTGCARDKSPPATPAQTADFAIVNARVWTGDPALPWAEALSVAGDRILRVGTSDEIRAAEATRTVDAMGKLVVPGFIDTHVHLTEGGLSLAGVQLRDVKSREEFAERIRAFAATVPPGTWILHGEWDHTVWGGELPTRQWIDAVTPDHPVWVTRLDGHMSLANSAALKLANVTRATREVAGGQIVRDAKGDPTGILKDNAASLVDAVVPATPVELKDRALAAAMKHVNERGVTSVHHLGDFDGLETFARAHKAGTMTTRIYAAVPLSEWERLRDVLAAKTYGGNDGRGDNWLRIGGLKGFVDGSLGSHTAAFNQPFDDAPNDRGLLVSTPEDLYQWVSGADKAGLHVMVHAIGDRANDLILDIYQKVGQENGARDRRFRVEHAQHLTAAAIPRFGALGVIASMQPYHAIDDGRWAGKLIGDRVRTTYAFRTLLDTKARLSFGSDWSVAPVSPILGIYAAVTRRTLDDANPQGWVPEQKITVEEALRAYTATAAYASFEENEKGSIAAGRLADVVMLDRDLFKIPPEQIRDAQVNLTMVGGKVVYQSGEGAAQ